MTPRSLGHRDGHRAAPIVERTLVRTTSTVPDGGTLLLGGQTLAGEIEREAGVPILSKVPFLKRLFTNRSTAKDEQVLLTSSSRRSSSPRSRSASSSRPEPRG